MVCRCGCGQPIKRGRVFVNKLHQLDWMASGGAREIGALQPLEAKAEGGRVAGAIALKSGRLREAGIKGGARARKIAEQWRARRKPRRRLP
jgi:hypothetical protein